MYKQASPQSRPELFDRSLLEIDSPVVQRKPPTLPMQPSRVVSFQQEPISQHGFLQVSNTPRQTISTASPLQQVTPSGRYNQAEPPPLNVLVPSTSSPPPLLQEFPPRQPQQAGSRPQESSRQSLPSQMQNNDFLPVVGPYPSRSQQPRQSSVTRRPVGAAVVPPSEHNHPTRRQVGTPSNPDPPVATQYPSGSETTVMPGMPAQNVPPQYRAYNSTISVPQALQVSRSESQPAVRISSVPNYEEYNVHGQPAPVSSATSAAVPAYGGTSYPRRSTNPGPLQAVQPSNRVSMQAQDYSGSNVTNTGYSQPARPNIRPSQDYRGTYPSPSQPAQLSNQVSAPSQEYLGRASTNNSAPLGTMPGSQGAMPTSIYNGSVYVGNAQYDNGRTQQGQPQSQAQQQRPRPPLLQNNDSFGNVAGELKNTWNRFRG
ncbi:hypothetical protein BJ875DRAFT_252635 [Amylocarpus encephaloides]|uniref:Uncharacterized protein n=1 Tax=Amylocarpus encephaloides TaxID=45428 RepID=A0A9P7YLF2_9HELO|nr:hypothetical protein BJ875DRAFT_252635 [Amylocarpus encephaloides]